LGSLYYGYSLSEKNENNNNKYNYMGPIDTARALLLFRCAHVRVAYYTILYYLVVFVAYADISLYLDQVVFSKKGKINQFKLYA